MTFVLWLFALALLLEVATQSYRALWLARRVLVAVVLVLNAFAAGVVLMWRPNVASGLFTLLSAYRLFNNIRMVDGRMHELYLRLATRRTTIVLALAQVALGAVWWLWQARSSHHTVLWVMLAAVQLLFAGVFLASTMRRLQRTAWPAQLKAASDKDLPTLSVAIPARNETDDLQRCLESLVACDYPKLEILVLDDCSQTKRTPEIIRQFAHDGVRFIQGKEPRDTWLPKNEAYERLYKESSGDYILFCGADLRFAPQSLRQIMEFLLSKQKKMLSIVPERAAESVGINLAQGMRYFWELAPPRRLFRRPSVLDSCWVIEREALKHAGGFAAVSRSIVPAASFARQLIRADAYSFMRAGQNPGVQSAKVVSDQRATAIRTRYPQLHRRPENVCLVMLAELCFLILPFVVALTGHWIGAPWPAQVLAALASASLVVDYWLIARSTRLHPAWFSFIALPCMAVDDILLLHLSMWRYEFSVVDWRGRNICVPAMHVVPHLPQLPPTANQGSR